MRTTEDKLYVTLPNGKRPHSIKKFLEWYFLEGPTKATYRNKSCGNMHTGRGKQRSVKDLYTLCKTYYPSINKKKFFKLFKELCETKNVKGRFCGFVRGIVFSKKTSFGKPDPIHPFIYKKGTLAHHNDEDIKSYGYAKDQYTLKELKQLMS